MTCTRKIIPYKEGGSECSTVKTVSVERSLSLCDGSSEVDGRRGPSPKPGQTHLEQTCLGMSLTRTTPVPGVPSAKTPTPDAHHRTSSRHRSGASAFQDFSAKDSRKAALSSPQGKGAAHPLQISTSTHSKVSQSPALHGSILRYPQFSFFYILSKLCFLLWPFKALL